MRPAVIFAHNHPSGVAEPSRADELLTASLKQALALVDIRTLDHLVVAGSRVVSFAERGLGLTNLIRPAFRAIIVGFTSSTPSISRSEPWLESVKSPEKAPITGNHVSHANNKTKRRFLPNLQRRRFWVEGENRWVSLRLTTNALRTIDKNGIEVVLADMRARGEHV